MFGRPLAGATYWVLLLHNPLSYMLNLRLHDDEFKVLAQAWAIAQGQLLYRDLWDYLPPFSFQVMAWTFQLTGPSFDVARGVAALTVGAILALSHRLGRELGAGPWAALFAMAGVAFGVLPFFRTWYPHWLAWALVLGAFLLALRWLRASLTEAPSAWGWGLGAGALVALAGLSSQSAGPVGAVGLGSLWLGAWAMGGGGKRVAWQGALALGLGLVGPLLATAAFFAAHGAGAAMWEQVVLWPAQHYRQAGGINDVQPFTDLEQLFPRWRHATPLPFWLGQLLAWLMASASPFVGGALGALGLLWGLFLSLWRAWRPSPQALGWGMVAGAAVAQAHFAASGRGDVTHLAIAGPLAWVLAAPLLGRWHQLLQAGRAAWAPAPLAPSDDATRGPLAWAAVATALACLLPFQLLELRSQMGFAKSGHLVWRKDPLFRESELVRAVRQHLPPGGRLFFFPYGGVPFLFTPAQNATRFGVLTPDWQRFQGAETRAAFAQEQREKGLPDLIAMTTAHEHTAEREWGGYPRLARDYRLVARPAPLPGPGDGYVLFALRPEARHTGQDRLEGKGKPEPKRQR